MVFTPPPKTDGFPWKNPGTPPWISWAKSPERSGEGDRSSTGAGESAHRRMKRRIDDECVRMCRRGIDRKSPGSHRAMNLIVNPLEVQDEDDVILAIEHPGVL